jgi:tRNA (guanine-N7-)-methyltransferase
MDRSIDFSGHLRELSELPADFDLNEWLPGSGPLEIEIGSGKGLFLLNQSAEQPETRFLGIEIAKKYARYAAYRLAKFERTNARFIRGDAIKFLEHNVRDGSVEALHVYFPDPWWKAKHRKRRVVSTELAGLAERVLVVGGRLHFWTDVEEYFETGCEAILSGSSRLQGPIAEMLESGVEESDLNFRTHFERRMLVNRHDVFRCKFIKAALDGGSN